MAVRFKFKSGGFAAVLNSPGVRGEITRRTNAIAEAAGDGFDGDVIDGSYGGGRPIGIVRTANTSARRAEAKDKKLSKAIDAGR